MVVCPSCGAGNPDRAVYCERCHAELPYSPSVARQGQGKEDSAIPGWLKKTELEGDRDPNPVVAIAVNVRRIFILLGVMVLLTLVGYVLSLIVSLMDYDLTYEGAKALGVLSCVVAVIIVGAGLWYAVQVKRVTRP